MAEHDTARRIQYIDGLRAVAVLGVVVFHLNIGALPNGFLGVDVFFVISGFVITRSLSSSGQRRLLPFLERFYRKRFWRLLPPLIIVVIVTVIATALFVPPVWISRHIFFSGIGALTGTSNIVLTAASGSGYFQAESDFNPFLHTWSLGVEEQFYLLYPLLFWLIAYLTRARSVAWVKWIIPALGVISFVLAIWLSVSAPTFAFYMLPTRFWELVAGAVAFQLLSRAQARVGVGPLRTGLGWGALVLVISSFFGPTAWGSPLPAGIAPVLGTVLLLWFSPGKGGWGTSERWLSARPVTYIGRISYSLYLWHWPVVVLLRWTTGIESPFWIAVGLVLMFALAMASYHLIERPLQTAAFSRVALPSVVFVLLGALLLGGIAGVLRYGAGKDFVRFLPSSSAIVTERGWQPQDMPNLGPPVLGAVTDTSRPELLVMGDSHAGAYLGAATVVANELDMRMKVSTLPGCGYTLLSDIDQDGACAQQKRDLAELRAGDVVVLAALRVPRYNDMDGEPSPVYDADSPEEVANRVQALAQVDKLVDELSARGVAVIVDGPKPLFEVVPLRCADWFNEANPVCTGRSDIPKAELLKRSAPAIEQIEALRKAHPTVVEWDLFDALCPGATCRAFDDEGHPLYADTDHLSGWGNELIVASLRDAVAAARGR